MSGSTVLTVKRQSDMDAGSQLAFSFSVTLKP